MKLWTLSTLCTASLLILSGCATSPTPPQELKIDPSLPKVSLTQNGVIVDMKTVAFEWSSIKDPRVEGVYVYKQNPNIQETAFEEYENNTFIKNQN
jgi:PBP1b-binding outer membrane lipoprotein LpoB